MVNKTKNEKECCSPQLFVSENITDNKSNFDALGLSHDMLSLSKN